MNSSIKAIGKYVPKKVLTNQDLEKMVETSDEWIRKRTGIKTRHIAEKETTVQMAVAATKDMMSRFNVDVSDVDFILFSSSTGEHKIPSLASQLQDQLGIPNCGALDISAACAGFVYGINLAQSLIHTGNHKKILVMASEILTNHTDYDDRATCILFGDGASVVLIEADEEATNYKTINGTEGDKGYVLYLSDNQDKINNEPINNNNNIYQDGRAVFKWAVERMSQKFGELLDKNNLAPTDINYFIPHSANTRIIEAIGSNVGISKDQTLESIVDYGNTSAVTIPLALNSGVEKGKLSHGDKLVLLGFGGGLTYSGCVIEWRAN